MPGAGSTSLKFRLDELRAGIKPMRLHWFSRLRSTNDHAVQLRRRGELYAPAVIVTSHQTSGRGRGANTWWSDRGCITATFVLAADEHHPWQVPLIAGLAVRDAVAELLDRDDIEIKWPNDILHRGLKLAGMLCERVHKADLVGVGLNVNVPAPRIPRSLRRSASSLSQIAGHEIDMTTALVALSRHIHDELSRRGQRPFSEMLRRYDAHHYLVGRQVTVSSDGTEPSITGRCEGLDRSGRLVVRSRTRVHHVIAGQVSDVSRHAIV